ncbi:MAG: CPBP family glutamic-type intramembrane protease [Candidatus Heimdallarchaeota archaeon]
MSEENKDQGNEKEVTKPKCIKCGATNPPNNLFCTVCGHNFVAKVKCPKCGGEVPAFNTFCNHCGATMKTDHTVTSQKKVRIVTEVQQDQQPPQSSFRYQQQQQQQQHYGYQSQMRPMTEEEALRYQDQLKAQQLYARNRTAKWFGMFLIAVGVMNIGSFFLVAFSRGTEIAETMLSLYGITFEDYLPGQFYGSLIATYILQGLIALAMGSALIFYKPDDNAWKGFSKVIRYIFLGLVSFIALAIIGSLLFWMFYSPKITITGELPFFLFAILGIPVSMQVNLLIAIFMTVFVICTGLLIGPSIYNYVKDRKKKIEGVPEVIIEDTPTISMQEGHSFSPLISYSEVEKRKVRMPDIFYRIKNSSIIKTFELLGLMSLVSLVIAFLFLLTDAIPPKDLEPATGVSQEVLFISTTWAGIAEEVAFRLILIGVPMIAVVAVRYYIENGKISMPSYQKYVQGTTFFKIKSRVARIDNNLALTKWDIPLAIRGKYKRVGYPEWILIGISSLIFGFAHWEGWEGVGGWGAWKIAHAGAIGVFLGYAFVKYGIESAIVLHFTNNAIGAITQISVGSELNGMLGSMTFLVTSFTLLGMMKLFSEALNLISKYRMRREAMLTQRY